MKTIDNTPLYNQLAKIVGAAGFTARKSSFEEDLICIEDPTHTVNFFTNHDTKIDTEERYIASYIRFTASVARCSNPSGAEDLKMFAKKLTDAAGLIERLNALEIGFVMVENW